MRASGEQQLQRQQQQHEEYSVAVQRGDSGKSDPSQDHSGSSWSLLLRLGLVGFFVNCQPSEPFLTRFLVENKGLTTQQLDDDVWPWDTYGSFAFLLPVGLLADALGYRTVIFAGLLCRECTRVLLVFGSGVNAMATMQVTYAGATAANTVYFAYVYQVVPRPDFQLATGVVVAAYHLGNACGSALCQLLSASFEIESHLASLFFVSWGFTTLGLACFLCMPPPLRPANAEPLAKLLLQEGFGALLCEVRQVWQSPAGMVWSVWWLGGGVADSRREGPCARRRRRRGPRALRSSRYESQRRQR